MEPGATILTAGVEDALPSLPSASHHAMLTDPPYGLEFMGSEWDYGVPSPTVWRETLRVLRPGALALVFGGTRTWHHLAVSLEQAGFTIRDTLLWLHGQGFPKGYNLRRDESATAAGWAGHGTQLKPAWEPILLAQAPMGGTVAETALEHGTGALWIEDARTPAGRYPANVLLDQASAALLDAEVGRRASGKARKRRHPEATPPDRRGAAAGKHTYGTWRPGDGQPEGQTYGDAGAPSRWFYATKASPDEREAGLEHLPVSPYGQSSGAQAAMKRGETYQEESASTGLNRVKHVRNTHPTVKPIDLTRRLASLLLPPRTVPDRRILIPYGGVASEAIGALLAGWDAATMIEMDPIYTSIARARLEHHAPSATMAPLFRW